MAKRKLPSISLLGQGSSVLRTHDAWAPHGIPSLPRVAVMALPIDLSRKKPHSHQGTSQLAMRYAIAAMVVAINPSCLPGASANSMAIVMTWQGLGQGFGDLLFPAQHL